MDVTTRTATPDDLTDLVALAEEAQRTPTRHIAYLASDAEAIEAEMIGLEGWPGNCVVAVRDSGPIGWLQGESDPDIGRVWWWGPFVAAGEPPDTALQLYDAAAALLDPAITQEEMGPDDRNDIVVAVAGARGFRGETASMVLSRTAEPATVPDVVRPYEPGDADAVAALHDRLFAGTHTTGAGLVDPAASRHLLVAEAGTIAGYIAFEVQADGSGYIDFVAVDPDQRRKGIAAALVTGACTQLDDLDVTRIHLTVRENNTAARALYGRLGFIEERVIRPYRKGFSLD
jgi:ribosomal protein S18 acetylase RimI-like enzyme